jgi:hypothetical protein
MSITHNIRTIKLLNTYKMNKAWLLCLLGNLASVILIFILLFAGGVIESLDSNCIEIKNCTYLVVDKYPSDLYFEYVLNNRYLCARNCPNVSDIRTCPINNSPCIITKEVKHWCKYRGFEVLYQCRNWTNTYLPILFILLAVIVFGIIVFNNVMFLFPRCGCDPQKDRFDDRRNYDYREEVLQATIQSHPQTETTRLI